LIAHGFLCLVEEKGERPLVLGIFEEVFLFHRVAGKIVELLWLELLFPREGMVEKEFPLAGLGSSVGANGDPGAFFVVGFGRFVVVVGNDGNTGRKGFSSQGGKLADAVLGASTVAGEWR